MLFLKTTEERDHAGWGEECVCVCVREREMQTLLSENTSFTHITQKHLTVRKREQDWSQMAPESTMVITVFKTVPRQLVMHEIKIIGRSRTKLKLCWRPNTVFHIYFPPVAIFCFFFFIELNNQNMLFTVLSCFSKKQIYKYLLNIENGLTF